MYNTNITRLRAEEDIRLLAILATASAGGEALKSTFERLEREQGKVAIVEAVMDKDAIARLKALSGKING